MSTANKLTYLNDTKTLLKQKINNLGGDITSETTFRQYVDKLQTIYDNAPKTDYAEGSNITLSNCLKGKIDYEDDKVGYGDTEQAIIPSDYQQVEYIESTGPAYIDTGFIPNTNTKIDIEFETIQKGTNGVIFGGEETYKANSFHLYNSTEMFDIGFGSKSTDFKTSINYNTNIKYTLIMDKNGFDVNGSTGTFPEPTISTNSNIFLFAVKRASSMVIDSNAQKRIYYCKLYDNGTLVRNMIPCYRISDNVIGMYDIVNNTFYTNAGTGTFTKGNNAPTPTTPIPVKCVTGEQEVKIYEQLLNATIEQGTIASATGEDTASDTRIRTKEFNDIQANTTYNIICNNQNLYKNNIYCYDSSGNFLSTVGNAQIWDSSFTTPNNCTKIRFMFAYLTNINITPSDISNVILYKNTPITKQLSLGDIELAKIGDYRDYIWKNLSNGKWYKKEYIGKKIFNGTETNVNLSTDRGFTRFDIKNVITDMIHNVGRTQVYSNYFYYSYTAYGVGVCFAYYINNGVVFFYPEQTIDTVDKFKTWLSTHNTILYYQLETPNDTEITDTSLINQLEDIWSMQSVNGTTIVEINGNLAMIIKCRALKGE